MASELCCVICNYYWLLISAACGFCVFLNILNGFCMVFNLAWLLLSRRNGETRRVEDPPAPPYPPFAVVVPCFCYCVL